MKALHKFILLGGAVAAAITVSRQMRRFKAELERDARIPTLNPVRDAEPDKPGPLREADLNVAQNAPF